MGSELEEVSAGQRGDDLSINKNKCNGLKQSNMLESISSQWYKKY